MKQQQELSLPPWARLAEQNRKGEGVEVRETVYAWVWTLFAAQSHLMYKMVDRFIISPPSDNYTIGIKQFTIPLYHEVSIGNLLKACYTRNNMGKPACGDLHGSPWSQFPYSIHRQMYEPEQLP